MMCLFSNPSICEYECDNKLWDSGEYLDYASCKCRKKPINKLVKKCNKDIDRNEMVYNATLNNYGRVCTLYIVLIIITFITIIGIIGGCVCFYWYTIKKSFNKLSY